MKEIRNYRHLPEGQIPALSQGAINGVDEGSIMPLCMWRGGSQLALPPTPAPRWGTPEWFAAEIARTDHEQQARFDAYEQNLKKLLNDLNFLIGVEAYSENKIALNTARDIRLGQLLNEMKKITKKLFIKWTDWADQNIALTKRTREIVMRIARYNFDTKWHKLGKSKLDRVCAALEPRFNKSDDVNLVMEYLIKRCGEDVFSDNDPRLESEIHGMFSSCIVLKKYPDKIKNIPILIAAGNSGLKANESMLVSFKTLTDSQLEKELERIVETGASTSAKALAPVTKSVKRSDEIFDQLEQYHAMYMAEETTDSFDKVRSKNAIKLIEQMLAR
jgi:hypothetical protein